MSMASNPSRPYGVGLLDDIHTLFPELLYDSHFNNDVSQFVRGRVEYLYNDVYTRNRSRWAGIQQANFNTWREQQTPRQTRNPYVANNIIHTPITPIRATPIQTSPPAPVRRTRTYTTAADNAIVSLLASVARPTENMPMMDFMDLMLRAETIPNMYVDVPVVPTVAEINTGSRLIAATDIPSDALCTICQERGTTTSWRQLNCTHRFHNDCILPWFERNSQCPVCRADLRAMAAIASALASPSPAPAEPTRGTAGTAGTAATVPTENLNPSTA